jgi:hypothetical protein
MNPAIFDKPFFEFTLPIMGTIIACVVWAMISTDNRRLDDMRTDMNRQFGEINKRLERIEGKLDGHESRITVLEERTSPLRR